jgi:hypothetical protein
MATIRADCPSREQRHETILRKFAIAALVLGGLRRSAEMPCRRKPRRYDAALRGAADASAPVMLYPKPAPPRQAKRITRIDGMPVAE